MAHIYLTFDFAKDEEKAQQARHKLEGWKQAFRLDKKLLYKIERTGAAPTDGEAKPAKAEKAKGKDKGKDKGKTSAAASRSTKPSASKASGEEIVNDTDCTAFLQWALPQIDLRWPGFRKVRRQVCRRLKARMREEALPSSR